MTQSSPPLSTNQPEFLLASEVASVLRISLATVYQWCACQKIPHTKLHGVIRFERQRLEQWLHEQAHPGTTAASDSKPSPAKPPTLSRQNLHMAGQRVVRRRGEPLGQSSEPRRESPRQTAGRA